MKVLIIGARPDSLGEHVRRAAVESEYSVVTAGVTEEDVHWDATIGDTAGLIELTRPDHVICTLGINFMDEPFSYSLDMAHQLTVNAVVPMMLLSAWARYYSAGYPSGQLLSETHHFVVIGSNSASIARSSSAAYCMSKAALAQGVRVASRSLARTNPGLSVYGYEPGLLEGTPMTAATASGFLDKELHRMPTGKAIDTEWLAKLIVFNLRSGTNLTGCMLRIDQGEQ